MSSKLLFIITQSEFGGAQRFLFEIASNLTSTDYEVLVAVGTTGDGVLTAKLKEKGISVHNLHFLKREPGLISDIKALREIRKLLKDFRPDTLFLLSSKAGFIGSLAAVFPFRLPIKKIIYRIGGWTFNDPWPRWKRQFWILLERISAKWKDIIIVNNTEDLEWAKKLSIKPRLDVVLIHNGIDPYRIQAQSPESARKEIERLIYIESHQNGHVIIGTIANFYPSKGLEYLIKAAPYLSRTLNVRFVIIGDGRERNKLENLIRELKVQDSVFLLGNINDAQKLIPGFDIFVLPSVKEGFSWVLLDALALKVPVIATNVNGVRDVIQDGVNGLLVRPKDPKQIATAIERLISNDKLKLELAIQGHQTVLFNFGADKMLREVKALL